MSAFSNPESWIHSRRWADSRAHLNGIDSIEVSTDQRTLTVGFFGKAPGNIGIANVRIEGGVRVRDIAIVEVRLCSVDNPDATDCVLVSLDRPGDASIYTLSIAGLAGFDPRYSQLDFSFRPDCPSDLDCVPAQMVAPFHGVDPELNYLGRDYQAFRQLLLDRLSVSMPGTAERHIPDLGIALVEALAYVGDRLSYYQDAVATEAYIGTARKRISVRRHARLMDYGLHEGTNARAFVTVEVAGADVPGLDPRKIDFITACEAVSPDSRGLLSAAAMAAVPPSHYEVFQPVFPRPVTFWQAHNRIPFYTWGDHEYTIPKGAVSATLRDSWETPAAPPPSPGQKGEYRAGSQPEPPVEPLRMLRHLAPGDLLIFEEVRGPRTGSEADADPSHRHTVLLTHVTPSVDPLYPLDIQQKQPVVEIRWAAEDALPFSLSLSAITPPDCAIQEISVARGNVLLVDHGRLVENEDLGPVPAVEAMQPCESEGQPQERIFRAGKFQPALARSPLTFCQNPGTPASAAAMLRQDAHHADPQILSLKEGSQKGAAEWHCRADLLGSSESDSAYCVEVDDDGIAHLRFGNGDVGRAPLFAGSNAVEWTIKGHPNPDAAPVSATGELQLIVGEDQFPLRLTPGSNHLNGLRDAIEAAGAGVTARIWKRRGHSDPYLLYLTVDRIGQTALQLLDNPGPGAIDLLTRRKKQGSDSPPFLATYRIGKGPAGNVGAEAICGIVLRDSALSGVTVAPRNPLSAVGGTVPEPLPEAKLRIPTAFRKDLQRAITADDYARLAERHAKVQRAAATLRWTGSRYAVRVAIDPEETSMASEDLLREVAELLYPYRRIGHDIQVVQASYVAVHLELQVCVDPDYSRGHVKAALLDAFGNKALPGGALGFFYPDNLTFGDSVYLSRLVTAALAVPGVQTARVTVLHRLFESAGDEIEKGVLPIGPLEVARLDNDPNRPENGLLLLKLEGGR